MLDVTALRHTGAKTRESTEHIKHGERLQRVPVKGHGAPCVHLNDLSPTRTCVMNLRSRPPPVLQLCPPGPDTATRPVRPQGTCCVAGPLPSRGFGPCTRRRGARGPQLRALSWRIWFLPAAGALVPGGHKEKCVQWGTQQPVEGVSWHQPLPPSRRQRGLMTRGNMFSKCHPFWGG